MGWLSVLALLNGETLFSFLIVGLVLWYLFRPAKQPAVEGVVVASDGHFDPFTHLRTVAGLKGVKVSLPGTAAASDGQPEAITLNDDFIAVARRNAEVQAVLLDATTVARLNLGSLPGYAETRYHMILQHSGVAVRLPVSFNGWLEVFDACRRAGGELEAAAEISDQMRSIVLGKDGARRVPSPEPPTSTRGKGPVKCSACGASLGRRGTCDYCGSLV